MKKSIAALVTVGIITVLLCLSVVLIVVMNLKKYHDNNSWAEFEIIGEGINEGSRIYNCTPNVNVKDVPGSKLYGKGETILLDSADFTIDRVDIGKTEAVSISSESEMIYQRNSVHKVYLRKGEEFKLRENGKVWIVKLVSIGYQ